MKQLFSSRGIQISIAILWLVDGLLQLQPQMFTTNFATQVIAPAAADQPFFISTIMNIALQIISVHPLLYDLFFAGIQLAIGVLILVKPTVRIGLIASALWGLMVWLLGEGAGGIFSGQTLLLTGAPGAALLYSLISLAVYPRRHDKEVKNLQPAAWLVIVWVVIWVGGSIYQVFPGQNTASDVGAMIRDNAKGAPAWLNTIDIKVGNFVSQLGSTSATSMTDMNSDQMAHMQQTPNQSTGAWFIILLALAQFLIGILVFLPSRARKIVVIAGSIVSILFWVFGQSLGEYYSGLATDPNTSPLIILLGIAMLANTQLDAVLANLYKRIIKRLSEIGDPDGNQALKRSPKSNRF